MFMRLRFCQVPWTYIYEAHLLRAAERCALDAKPDPFFSDRTRAGIPESFPGYARARLAAARFLSADCYLFGGSSAGGSRGRLRSPAHLVLHGESRQHF